MGVISDEPAALRAPEMHSGHFRHQQAAIWDPHPRYTFVAFGQTFQLQLQHDDSFVAPEIVVSSPTRHHLQAVIRAKHGSFYSRSLLPKLNGLACVPGGAHLAEFVGEIVRPDSVLLHREGPGGPGVHRRGQLVPWYGKCHSTP